MEQEIKQELYDIINVLSLSALFDNDGALFGYFKESWKENEYKLLRKKNKLIKKGVIKEEGFQIMMFNYIEAPEELDGLDRIPFQYALLEFKDIPEEGLDLSTQL